MWNKEVLTYAVELVILVLWVFVLAKLADKETR